MRHSLPISGTCLTAPYDSRLVGCKTGVRVYDNDMMSCFFSYRDCLGGSEEGVVLSLTTSGLVLRVNLVTSTEPIAGYEFSLTKSFESLDGKLSSAFGFLTSSSTNNDKVSSENRIRALLSTLRFF